MSQRFVRLLDVGEVPYLRSQTIYHAVADAFREDSPATIVLLTPRQAYACLGYHQDVEQEIDLGYCRSHRLPVLRRQVGGGTVYLDSRQLFYHCIFHRGQAPRRAADLYRLCLRGPIETYRRLGVAAHLGGLNDIWVGDRKIGGTGAGTIGEAVVVCGSLVFGFDHATMAGLLRAPSPAFRLQTERLLRRYVTSLWGELGHEVPRATARDLLVEQLATALAAEVRPGQLDEREWAAVHRLDALFSSEAWLRAIVRPPAPVRQVKIRAGVGVYATACRAGSHRAEVTLSLVDGAIDAVDLSCQPPLDDGEREGVVEALVGKRLAPSGEGDGLALGGAAALDPVHSCLSAIAQAAAKGT